MFDNKEKFEIAFGRINDLEEELASLKIFNKNNSLSVDQTLRLECLNIAKDLIAAGAVPSWSTTNVVDLVDNLVEYVKTGKLGSE